MASQQKHESGTAWAQAVVTGQKTIPETDFTDSAGYEPSAVQSEQQGAQQQMQALVQCTDAAAQQCSETKQPSACPVHLGCSVINCDGVLVRNRGALGAAAQLR